MKNGSFLQANIVNRGLVFDLRTKLILLFTMSSFVLGGIAGEGLSFLLPCLWILPFSLFLSARKYSSAVLYFIAYAGVYSLNYMAAPYVKGVLACFLILFIEMAKLI